MPDWNKAEKHLKEIRQMYTDIGSSGMMALTLTINPLFIRYKTGERSAKLFKEIMDLEYGFRIK